MASATRIRTFGVLCPKCMNAEETLTLDLNDLGEVTCGCGESFSPTEAATLFADLAMKWNRVAVWVAAAPTT